ncbi:DNA topology modulation protein FlaR [Alkalicoccobacillus porphyridii]|uniref:DNA topology modulation protein FlaR n=1 Tax=Alkalicoccobacillus porphyridii TaxID=2597270 RepID=A0A553ZWZ3_9BACI|nr:DNA topology modulation protein FlaR [Alkalicoccobacillus porphyridii]TSB45963.1 DNA topology modulation protein FlaR [Alkalicoccobacillus porphyridii]
MNTRPEKIRIVGSVGSGKTTLAKILSNKVQIPYYELDTVVWKRDSSGGDIRRTEQERDNYLSSLLNSTSWIIEGVHFQNWVLHTFDRAQLVIFIDTPYLLRIYRITLRYLKQITGKEASHYDPTFKIFLDMFKWNHDFEYSAKPKLLRYIKENNLNCITIKNEKELKRFLQDIHTTDKRNAQYARE